jgi:hypothetical protein
MEDIKKQTYVSFETKGGRFGNQLFRYLTCKLFTLNFGHKYIYENEFKKDDDYIIVTEENINSILKNTLSKLCRLITLNNNFRLRIGITFVLRE